jgi:hypothetical protein
VTAIDVDALAAAVRRRAPGGPLDRVETALTLGAELTSGADELIEQFVTEARQAGNSWTEIGARMGVSKQAARQRFVPGQAAPTSTLPHRRLRRRPHGKAALLRCSFCGKASADHVRLIAGPGVYICAECVGLCTEILATSVDPAAR